MSAIKVNFEIGHVASVRTKKTPEGFTHDWEVFVRGTEGADISHFVEKVVFHLHETFPKPKRVVKEAPFSIKESGYAGFIFPIDIYVKNKDEPRKIKFTYDFTLQNSGFLRDRYVFQNPNEEFRKKLLKGGGIPVSNDTFYTNPDQENRSRDSFTEEKQQLISKPKLSSDNAKKHKSKEHKNEMPHRTSSFENLFGPPIQKTSKISPEPKKNDKTSSTAVKPERKEKDRPSAEKKSKHETKDVKPEKPKLKEEKEKVRPENNKGHSKEQERSKDKSNKRPSDRVPSPEPPKKRANLSPGRKPASPPARSSSASSIKEDYKSSKHNVDTNEHKKKFEEKPVKTDEPILNKEVKEKKKKDKKSHDRDKERKEKKDYKKESHKPKEPPKEVVKEIPKPREIPKEKEPIKEPIREKPPKPEKPINKFSIENLRKSPVENEERTENHKSKERGDSERKHKHKKKDKKRDDSKEKHKESNKEKKHKHDKNRDIPPEKPEVVERREPTIFKERPLPEPASPISLDTASQCSSKSGIAKMSHIGAEDINSSHSDSESSMIVDDDDSKVKLENPSPVPHKRPPSPEPEPEPEPEVEPEPEPEPETEPVVEAPPPQPKEKSKKHKDKKDKREEKRRKRKANDDEDIENRNKGEMGPSNHDIERGESSGSMSVETKVQDNGVSSSLGEDAEPGDLSPDYMVQLRGLQQRIMMIKNNEDLERVVNLIAETGRYEVTTQTFDFDLCLLDRSTVQQLIQLVGC